MSKVQSPKSQVAGFGAVEASERTKATDGEGADSGNRSVDIGLRVTDLRKSFLSPEGERIEVLRGVTFSVSPGECVAIIGSSGAGKSTLLHLLGGLEAPDHGSIVAGEFAFESETQLAMARFRNSRVGFVFQFHHLLSDLTAAENVSLPLLIRRIHPREAMRQALQVLDEVGLRDRSSHLVGNLSGGEQQRVALCRALVNQPSLVLADEPTGNLDTTIGDEIARSLVAYAKRVRGNVILATHSHAVASLCDRILTLSGGRLSPA